MTTKEAIKRLELRYNPFAYGIPMDEHGEEAAINEAIVMAIQALKKQTPTMPSEEIMHYSPKSQMTRFYCPSCGATLIHKDEAGWFAGKRAKFCECGQALDWPEWIKGG